jgi:hypothetical protein
MASSCDASHKDNANGINNSQINASANGDANANANANANTYTTGRTAKRRRMNTDMLSKPPSSASHAPPMAAVVCCKHWRNEHIVFLTLQLQGC